ncbi:MAG: hypothetical protein JW724_04565 [Candidatus Altiarchaeota archaeon]|nr:hypothetical protein [Candidatus Altiarchaeota archaeon]
MKTRVNGFVLLCALLLAQAACATRVAVVIDMADGTVTRCVSAADNADGYVIFEDAGQDMAWTYYGSSLGHGLCSVNGLGCPSSNCFCNPDAYWNFYVKEAGGEWSYSAVGFDGGSTCSDHYCAADGEMLGLAYGGYGTEPPDYSFSDVCCGIPGDEAPCGTVSINEVVEYINVWTRGKASLGEVIDLINEWIESS